MLKLLDGVGKRTKKRLSRYFDYIWHMTLANDAFGALRCHSIGTSFSWTADLEPFSTGCSALVIHVYAKKIQGRQHNRFDKLHHFGIKNSNETTQSETWLYLTLKLFPYKMKASETPMKWNGSDNLLTSQFSPCQTWLMTVFFATPLKLLDSDSKVQKKTLFLDIRTTIEVTFRGLSRHLAMSTTEVNRSQ